MPSEAHPCQKSPGLPAGIMTTILPYQGSIQDITLENTRKRLNLDLPLQNLIIPKAVPLPSATCEVAWSSIPELDFPCYIKKLTQTIHIAILNTYYKILASAIAETIQQNLPEWAVAAEQLACKNVWGTAHGLQLDESISQVARQRFIMLTRTHIMLPVHPHKFNNNKAH